MAPLQNLLDFAFWTDRQGTNNTYFTGKIILILIENPFLSIIGSNYGYHVCDCHYEDEGCMEEASMNTTCNCDANIPVPLSDSGLITNMTALPVTKLYFGKY